jgi:hypothetical protein
MIIRRREDDVAVEVAGFGFAPGCESAVVFSGSVSTPIVPGTFHAHRPVYDDETWIPAALDYRVLVDDTSWWAETFAK